MLYWATIFVKSQKYINELLRTFLLHNNVSREALKMVRADHIAKNKIVDYAALNPFSGLHAIRNVH